MSLVRPAIVVTVFVVAVAAATAAAGVLYLLEAFC